MGFIIDATLSVLDDYDLDNKEICEFIKMIRNLGIKNIKMSSKTLGAIEGQLPGNITYYIDSLDNGLTDSDSLSNNILRFSHNDTISIHHNIRTREVNEVLFDRDGFICDMVHLKGFDSLILDGSDEILDRLDRRISFEKLIVTPGDGRRCANAVAYLFLQRGVHGVITTMTGISNHASTEQVVMARQVIANCDIYDVSVFSKLADWFERVTAAKIPPHFPVLGERIFHVESGVHVDGILKKSSNYEPYSPSLVGLKREIVLGKLSGRASINYKLRILLDQSRSKSDIDLILQRVKQLSIVKKGKLTDDDFVTIVKGLDGCEEYKNS